MEENNERSKAKTYVLDLKAIAKLEHGRDCRKCGVTINVGEPVVSRRGGAGKRIIYHQACAEELNII